MWKETIIAALLLVVLTISVLIYFQPKKEEAKEPIWTTREYSIVYQSKHGSILSILTKREGVLCNDTIVSDSSSFAVIEMFKYGERYRKQLQAAQNLLSSINCANIPDSLDYYNYKIQRVAYFKAMGWEEKDTKPCESVIFR